MSNVEVYGPRIVNVILNCLVSVISLEKEASWGDILHGCLSPRWTSNAVPHKYLSFDSYCWVPNCG